jgi:hypothetical protein
MVIVVTRPVRNVLFLGRCIPSVFKTLVERAVHNSAVQCSASPYQVHRYQVSQIILVLQCYTYTHLFDIKPDLLLVRQMRQHVLWCFVKPNVMQCGF